MLCSRITAPVSAATTRPSPRPVGIASRQTRRAPVCKAAAEPKQQAGIAVASGLAAILLASQPAMAETPTVGPKIGEGATLKGNNGFERKDYMRELEQRIAERAGKIPKAPDSSPTLKTNPNYPYPEPEN